MYSEGSGCPLSKLSSAKRRKDLSILQWFDKNVEAELVKRRAETHVQQPMTVDTKGLLNPEIVKASASGIDVNAELRGKQNTDLLDAVDKLAIAQAMDEFEGAVKAAEQAAASAPPEYAEEAAVAGARGFQAQLTSVVQETFDSIKPIEVVGYVGITRPKIPKRFN